jgi:outer membrane protein
MKPRWRVLALAAAGLGVCGPVARAAAPAAAEPVVPVPPADVGAAQRAAYPAAAAPLAVADVAGDVAVAAQAGGEHEAGPVLTLDTAVSRALGHHPSVEASREAAVAASYRVDQARFPFYPQILLSLGYRRATMNSPMPPYMADLASSPTAGAFSSFLSRETWDNYDNFSATATLSQTLWDGMRTIGSYQAAEDMAEGAKDDATSARDGVCLQVTQAYFSALATQEAVAAALETKRQMDQHVYVAEQQMAAEVRQRIDVTRAQADQASANMTVLRVRNAYDLARLNLNAAMGSSGPLHYRVERPGHGADPPAPDVDQAVRLAMAQRPEVRGQQAKARATEHLVMVANAGWWPTVSAQASWSHTGYKVSDLPFNWALGVNATWSALGGLQAYPAAREAEANERAAHANLDNLELGVRTEIESAVVAAEEARARLKPVEALVAAARETLRLAEGRYQAGAGNMVEVTDAQALYTQARLQVIQAELDLEVARVRLRKALGQTPCGKEER